MEGAPGSGYTLCGRGLAQGRREGEKGGGCRIASFFMFQKQLPILHALFVNRCLFRLYVILFVYIFINRDLKKKVKKAFVFAARYPGTSPF